MSSLYACSTATAKSSINQDYCLTVKNERANFIGVIIADGIGSHFKAELSSKFCCEKLKEQLEIVENASEINFELFFQEIKSSLLEFAKQSPEFNFNEINKTKSLGTTLLCALDLENEFLIAYAGNGSIWHTKGSFNKFSPNRYLPWNSVNLLNPHCNEEDGKAALYRYLSVSDAQYLPTVIRLSKNLFTPGDIIIVTSDGVYSSDQVQIGKDESETIWIRSEESMPMLYSELSDFLKNNPKETKNEDLEIALNIFLDNLKTKNYMHDDTTLGVIITEKAIDFHQQFWEQEIVKKLNEKNSSK
ncbi:MAG: protein phosphatase 2C domain-containing protein [Bacteroidia bacterium]|nr:protein phosphatase 2C domain-containing protein [Bacteroidia bacterium]